MVMAPFYSILSACKGNSNDIPKEALRTKKPSTKLPEKENIVVSEEDVVLLKRADAAFEKYRKGFNARVQKIPKYIALCKNTKGVQYAIQLARKEGIKVSIRSGGHSFEGFSSNDDGMVINLTMMNAIKWEEGNTVSLGPACLLIEIQQELFSKQRLIPTGSCGTVGIAGLTLGGGYGFFSRKYGLTCDSLIEVEFIDAQGTVHYASKNKDLMWALKGGGNGNFGVATKFTFRTQVMPKNFYAHVMKFRKLNVENFSEILKTWFEVSKQMAEEDFGAFVLNGSTLTVLTTTFGNRKLLEIKLLPLTALADSHTISDTDLPKAMRRYYGRKGPIYFKNASAGLYQSFEDLKRIAPLIFEKVADSKGLIFQINTLGGNINTPEFEEGSCYPHRKLPYLSELQAYYDHKEQEGSLLKLFEEVQLIIRKEGITAQYRNYPDVNFPNWQQAYYGTHYEKLQKIKAIFDPENIFSYPQSIELPS